MKKFVLAAVAAISILSVYPFAANAASAPVSTSTKVEWPDYKNSSWTVLGSEMLIVEAAVSLESNSSVVGPGKYDIRVGTVTTLVDAPDLDSSKLAVVEVDVLGTAPALRILYVNGMRGYIARQIMVKGKWKDIPGDARIEIKVENSEKVIRKDESPVVTLTVRNESGVLVSVSVENKLPAKQKK